MSIDIVSNRIPATPRSKYHKYMTASNVATQVANNGGSIDTSNFVVKTGETEQTVEGSFGAMQDIVAFKTAYSYFDSYLPIASATALGCVKVGAYLRIEEDGTLNAYSSGGASNWDELKGKPANLNNTNWTYAYTNAHKHAYLDTLNGITPTNVAYWNNAVSYMHTHNNKANLDSINQNLSTTSDVSFKSVKAINDIVAFSTGKSTETYPIASATALGCVKVGENLSIDSDGTLNAEAGGAANWDELKGKPDGLNNANITKWNTAAANSHVHSNKSILDNITSTKVSNWDSAVTNSHTHNNKTVLDDITSDKVSNWDTAVTKSHTHSNKANLDSINQNLSTTSDVSFKSVKAINDIVAFSTGKSTETYPIASATALGCIKVGENLSISSDGTLNAEAGGGAANWDELKGKPDGLTSANITKWNTAATNSHTHSNKTVLDGITSTKVSNWDSAATNKHTHSNKTTLDGITSDNVSNWNTAANNAHSHSNKTTLDNITDTKVSNWNTAANNAHSHSNKTTLDNINQNLSTSSGPTFAAGLTTGSTSGLNIKHSSGNAINGCNKSSIANLYFNYTDADKNVLVDAACNVKAYGDVVAYKTGSAPSPFKYWYPSVSTSGNLSWTNSTSTSTPNTVNIKGPKGDKGDAGKSVGKVSAYSTSSASSGKSTYNVYDTSNTLLGSFSVYNGAKGEKGDTGPQGPKGPAGSASNGGLINGLTWLRNPSSGSICYITGNAVSGYTSGSPNLWINWSPTAVASGTSCNYSYRVLKVGGKSEGTAILTVNDGNNGAFTGNYGGSSDIRLKENIVNVDNVLLALENIDIFKFNYKNDEDKQIHFGVSAQKVNEYYPELITYADNDEYGKTMVLKYIEFNTLMAVGCAKELHALVKDQQSQIDLLKQEIAELKNIISNK